jgi:hypothetical protein
VRKRLGHIVPGESFLSPGNPGIREVLVDWKAKTDNAIVVGEASRRNDSEPVILEKLNARGIALNRLSYVKQRRLVHVLRIDCDVANGDC